MPKQVGHKRVSHYRVVTDSMRIAGHLFQMPGISVVLVSTVERKQGELLKETIEVLPTCSFANFPRRCLFTDGKRGQHMPALQAAAYR